MVIADRIHKYIQRLPGRLQAEVLDFIEALLKKAEQDDAVQNERDWSNVSLSLAMRDLEDEDHPEYSVSDLKTSFK